MWKYSGDFVALMMELLGKSSLIYLTARVVQFIIMLPLVDNEGIFRTPSMLVVVRDNKGHQVASAKLMLGQVLVSGHLLVLQLQQNFVTIFCILCNF